MKTSEKVNKLQIKNQPNGMWEGLGFFSGTRKSFSWCRKKTVLMPCKLRELQMKISLSRHDPPNFRNWVDWGRASNKDINKYCIGLNYCIYHFGKKARLAILSSLA